MVNARGKGARTEKRVVDELENNGWLVYRVKGATKFNKEVDIFGLFDIFAIRRENRSFFMDAPTTYIKLIQVKTNYKPVLKIYKKFKLDYGDDFLSIEAWIWYDRKGFEKIIF